MRYFPIFIDLKDRPVTVVGGSEEALRKIRLLLKTGAVINVIAPEIHEELAAEPRVNWIAKRLSRRAARRCGPRLFRRCGAERARGGGCARPSAFR